MRKAKVLYITYNGVGESIFQSQCLPYIKGLSGKGYDITLLSYERDTGSIAAYRKKLKDYGIEWYWLKYHKKPRIIATAYDFLMGIFLVFFIALQKRIEVIHARATHGAIIGMPAAKLLRKKILFDTRGLDSEEYVDGNLIIKDSLLHKVLFNIEKYLFSQSDSIVLLSHKAKNLLEEKGLHGYLKKNHTYVIPCATDLDMFRCNIPKPIDKERALTFIYVGSIGTWYMMNEMLDFFITTKKRFANSRFVILTQSDSGKIYERIRRSKIEDSTKIDYVDHDSIPRYISSSDVGICFIRPVSSKRASSPTKIGEYLACGLPVTINSGIGDTEDIVRENNVGVIVEGFSELDYERAFDKLTKLLQDKEISARCRQTAEKHFSITDAVDKYGIIYRELVA